MIFSCGERKEKKDEKSKINFSEISGKWEGTYTGDEKGTFKGHISDNGSVSGNTSLGYIIDGSVNQNGDIKISFGKASSGAIFVGYYKNNRFIGTWKNNHYNLSGTFVAERSKRKEGDGANRAKVNQGIERTTESLKSKSAETYAAFDPAAELNEIKAGPFKKQAYKVKAKADSLVAFIQEMKYNLVLKADGMVYLGSESQNKDEDGKLIEGKGIEKEWKDLDSIQKTMPIAALSRKDDRHSSGDLFYNNKRKKNIATDLKNKMLEYKDFLLNSSSGNQSLMTSLNQTYTFADKKGKKGDPDINWEHYNFYDMPSVGALTLLSNMQLTVRNTEADVINMLMEKIDE